MKSIERTDFIDLVRAWLRVTHTIVVGVPNKV